MTAVLAAREGQLVVVTIEARVYDPEKVTSTYDVIRADVGPTITDKRVDLRRFPVRVKQVSPGYWESSDKTTCVWTDEDPTDVLVQSIPKPSGRGPGPIRYEDGCWVQFRRGRWVPA
jgi:hypothetical protein